MKLSKHSRVDQFTWIYYNPLSDFGQMPVKDLVKHLEDVMKEHGKNSVIRFSAGYNNIDCVIYPSKKQK